MNEEWAKLQEGSETPSALITGVLGEHVTRQYVTGKLKEWEAYRTQVSSWEIERYLITY